MPHLTLEYTRNLAATPPDPILFSRLHRLLRSRAGIKIENCKSRWRALDDWLVGEEEDSAFAHLSIRLLEGRSDPEKRELGEGALAILVDFFQGEEPAKKAQITVEVQEMRRSAYFKHPPGTLSPPAPLHV